VESYKPKSSPERRRADEIQRDLDAALDEEDRILAGIRDFLKAAPDRLEAEREVLRSYAPRMDDAWKKTKQLLEEWLAFIDAELAETLPEPEE
jgi:hypothetical protein